MALTVTSNIPSPPVWNRTDLFVVRFTTSLPATVYYTTDGTDPTTSSSVAVDGEFILRGQGIFEIKYFASDSNPLNDSITYSEYLELDNVSPTTTATADHSPEGANSWYRTPPTITLSSADTDSGVRKIYYRWNDDLFVEYTAPIGLPQSGGEYIQAAHRLEFYADDNAGNDEATKREFYKLDYDAPITVDDAPEGIQEEAVTVEFFHSDNASGPADTFFTTDGTTPTTESDTGTSVTLDETGDYDVQYFSVDKAGNQESVRATEVQVDIDDTPPSADDVYISENIPIDGDFGWYRTAPVLTITAVDPSGISEITYKFTPTDGNSSAKFTSPINLLPTIDWNSGTTYSIKLAIDGGTPAEITFTGLNTITEVVNQINDVLDQVIATETNVSGEIGVGYITLTSPTSGSGSTTSEIQFLQPSTGTDGTRILFGLEPNYYPYSFKETDIYIQYTGPIQLPTDGEWIIEFYAVDTRGNESPHQTKKYRLDRQPPVTRLKTTISSPDGRDGWYITDPQISFEVFDIASGAYKNYYRWDNGPLHETSGGTITPVQGENVLKYFSVDKAGNLESLHETTFKIDTVKPTSYDNTPELQGVIHTNRIPGWSVIENETASVLDLDQIQLTKENVKNAISIIEIVDFTPYTIVEHTVTPFAVGQYAEGTDRNILNITPDLSSSSALVRVDYEYDHSHMPETLNHDDAINEIGYSLVEPIYVPLSHDSDTTFRITPRDDESGVWYTWLEVYTAEETSSGFIKETQVFAGTATQYTLEDDGLFIFEYFTVDNAGNQENTRSTVPVKVDKNYPEITLSYPLPNGNNGWYKEPFDLTVLAITQDLITHIGGVPQSFVDTYQIIANENDQLDFKDDDGTTYTATIPASYPALYSEAILTTLIQDAMNTAVGAAKYVVSFSNYRFSIQNTLGNFELLWNSVTNERSIARTLGFDASSDDAGATTYTSDYYRVRMSQGITGTETSATLSSDGFTIQHVMSVLNNGPTFAELAYEQLAVPGAYGLYDEINIGGPLPTLSDLRIDYKHYVVMQQLDYALDSMIFIDYVDVIPGLTGYFDDLVFDSLGIPRGAQYRFDFSDTGPLPNRFFLDNGDGENHEVSFRAYDHNSLEDSDVPQKSSIVKTFIFDYDTTPPVLSDDVIDLTGYQGVPFIVTIYHNDDLSGMAATYYTLDGTVPTTSSVQADFIDESHSQIVLTQSGDFTVKYFGEDVAGNESTVRTAPYSILVDGDPPLTLASVDPTPPDGNVLWDTPTEQGWFVSIPTVTLTSSDTLSGLDQIYYRFGGDYVVNEYQPQLVFTTYSGPFQVGLEGNIDVEFYAADNAGNQETTQTLELHIDRTAPETIYDLSLQDSTLTVSFDANDEVSGYDKTFFALGTPVPTTSSFSDGTSLDIPEGSLLVTLNFYSKDKAGNTETPIRTEVIEPLEPPRLREVVPIPNAADVSTESNVTAHFIDTFGIDIDSVLVTIQGFEFSAVTEDILKVRYTGPRPNSRLTIQDNRFVTTLSGRLDVSVDLTDVQYNTVSKLNAYLNSLEYYESEYLSDEWHQNPSTNISRVQNEKIDAFLTLKHYVPDNNPNFSYIEKGLGYLVFVTPDFILSHRKYANVVITASNFIGKAMIPFEYSFNPSVVAKPSIWKRNYLHSEAESFIANIQERLASNYTRSKSSNFYGHHKSIALELSRIVEELEHQHDDAKFVTVRNQYLYEKFGNWLTIEPTINTYQSNTEYRSLLTSMLSIFLRGSLKSSIEEGIKIYSPFDIELTERVFETDDISEQFVVTVDYLIGTSRLFGGDFGLVIENLTKYFRIIKPAHVYIKQRSIFEEAPFQIRIADPLFRIVVDGTPGFALESPELPEVESSWSMSWLKEEENVGDAIGINKKAFTLNDLDSLLNDPDYLLSSQSFESLYSIEETYDLSTTNKNIKLNVDGAGAVEIDLTGADPANTNVYEIVEKINQAYTGTTSESGFVDNFVIETGTNDKIDFDEGGGELTATITAGTYTVSQLLTEIKTQMDAVGSDTYTISYSDDFTVLNNHRFTIASSGASLSLLWNTGTNAADTIGAYIGFDTSADDTGSTSYVADNPSRYGSMLGAIFIQGSTSIEFTAPSGNDATELIFGLDEGSYPHTFKDLFCNRNI